MTNHSLKSISSLHKGNTMKKFILYTIAFFGSFAISAQDTLITESDTIITNTGKIEVDQVEVIKAFKAKLDDAKKIGVKPTTLYLKYIQISINIQ